MQITLDEAVSVENNEVFFKTNSSYNYQIEFSGITMREYHVGMQPTLLNYIDGTNKKYGRNLSVRKGKNERSLIIFGEDKSIYHQLIFSKKYWKGPAGLNFIIPKDYRDILMLSGFQNREYGLVLDELLTPETMTLINIRRRVANYKTAEYARLLFLADLKSDLTNN